ncbi:MAG: NTP transferase domain-containing protein [Proteobacteria bacterium]|nr:NTP transferase domain-containing protein [Pseudomonadota bacterium]
MAHSPCLNHIDVIVLAGGLGTRIRDTLGDTPKLLARVNERPFLDFLIGRLKGFGAKRLVLGLGHLGGRVEEYLESHPPEGLDIVTLIEPEPLGTAGALRFVARLVESDPVMVMNGDSFIGADLCDFVQAHRRSGAEGSILAADVADTAEFGRLKVSPEGRVLEFSEKDPSQTGPGLINAGVYLFDAAMMARIEAMEGASLERDVFPALDPGTLGAAVGQGPFIDIGTPEDLLRAADVLKPFTPS